MTRPADARRRVFNAMRDAGKALTVTECSKLADVARNTAQRYMKMAVRLRMARALKIPLYYTRPDGTRRHRPASAYEWTLTLKEAE